MQKRHKCGSAERSKNSWLDLEHLFIAVTGSLLTMSAALKHSPLDRVMSPQLLSLYEATPPQANRKWNGGLKLKSKERLHSWSVRSIWMHRNLQWWQTKREGSYFNQKAAVLNNLSWFQVCRMRQTDSCDFVSLCSDTHCLLYWVLSGKTGKCKKKRFKVIVSKRL